MAVLDYAGYSALANTTWTASAGDFYGTSLVSRFDEIIEFGNETIFVGYKEIEVTYRVKDSILYGVLYIPETLETKFIFGGAEKLNGDFDLGGGVLLIYSTDSNIYIKYV